MSGAERESVCNAVGRCNVKGRYDERDMSMTLDEIAQIDREFITVAEASAYFGCNPQKLREQAHRDREKLGFPVSIIGNRVKIPKEAFIKFCKGESA